MRAATDLEYMYMYERRGGGGACGVGRGGRREGPRFLPVLQVGGDRFTALPLLPLSADTGQRRARPPRAPR